MTFQPGSLHPRNIKLHATNVLEVEPQSLKSVKMNLNPAPGLSPDDVKVLEQLRTRLTPLVYNIEQLQMEMARYQDAPPSW